ncbi:hypothetical protein OHU34_45370 (plasmid) [Streptomyces sp. NBC_00080]|uniref:hypothetical protein n=1 Tax=unclassified Streptomyces TaxID=2593676 RepID=UPI00114FB9CE|nr:MULTISPECIES: hypothetical protein [unclassified Streptomyces]TQJ37863.1 hypothetical protein FBY34_8031 [Streptomyces sp. SLBN-115]WSN45821.1 hypothetical protein OG736_44740 [Streptomyces sp. NBC_01334]
MGERLPQRRGLAELDENLSIEVQRCAQRLRELHERMDLPSYEVAERLSDEGMRVDKTRLSKFLNGREVPRHALAARFHRVLAEEEGTEVDPQEVSLTRTLMYEAARASGAALKAREHKLAEAAEAIEQERQRTAQQLTSLNSELEAERRLRQEAEEELKDLSSRTEEQIAALQAQRDAAQRRIDELQDQVAQAEALLRLQRSEAAMMTRAAAETAAELARWEQAPPRAAAMNVIAERFVEQVAQWRDQDEDQTAEAAIEHLSQTEPLTTARAIWNQFHSSQRMFDQQRMMTAIARFADPLELYRSVGMISSGKIHSSDWTGNLIAALADHAPPETVRRFHKAARERHNTKLVATLNRQLVKRQSRAARKALIKGSPALREELKTWRREEAKERASDIASALLTPFILPILKYLDRRERRQREKQDAAAQAHEQT